MEKTVNSEKTAAGTGSFGELLSALLNDSGKEIRFEVVCRIVDRNDVEKENADDRPSPSRQDVVFDSQNVPRPLSRAGRIDGIAALAKYLKCAPSTVQRMKNDGELPFYQRGRRIFFYEDEVLASMAQRPRRNSRQDGGGLVCEQTKFGTKYTPCNQ